MTRLALYAIGPKTDPNPETYDFITKNNFINPIKQYEQDSNLPYFLFETEFDRELNKLSTRNEISEQNMIIIQANKFLLSSMQSIDFSNQINQKTIKLDPNVLNFEEKHWKFVIFHIGMYTYVKKIDVETLDLSQIQTLSGNSLYSIKSLFPKIQNLIVAASFQDIPKHIKSLVKNGESGENKPIEFHESPKETDFRPRFEREKPAKAETQKIIAFEPNTRPLIRPLLNQSIGSISLDDVPHVFINPRLNPINCFITEFLDVISKRPKFIDTFYTSSASFSLSIDTSSEDSHLNHYYNVSSNLLLDISSRVVGGPCIALFHAQIFPNGFVSHISSFHVEQIENTMFSIILHGAFRGVYSTIFLFSRSIILSKSCTGYLITNDHLYFKNFTKK